MKPASFLNTTKYPLFNKVNHPSVCCLLADSQHSTIFSNLKKSRTSSPSPKYNHTFCDCLAYSSPSSSFFELLFVLLLGVPFSWQRKTTSKTDFKSEFCAPWFLVLFSFSFQVFTWKIFFYCPTFACVLALFEQY